MNFCVIYNSLIIDISLKIGWCSMGKAMEVKAVHVKLSMDSFGMADCQGEYQGIYPVNAKD